MSDQLGLNPGTLLLNGTYRIESILGHGGFGVTYIAKDLNLDKIVAIKEFFPKNYCNREEDTCNITVASLSARDLVQNLRKGFLREARNIAKLNHPNIIRILAAFEENNTAYYVMEYVEGQSLSDIVKNNGPLPIGVAVSFINRIGLALDYIHQNRINHLDVKPANIVLNKANNEPVLIDFGLSKHYDNNGDETAITPMGISHGYAPIEQYNYDGIKEFSPKSDLYSLAATLYYLLTATVPPQATELMSNPLTFPPTFPYQLTAVIQKAMAPNKNDRFNSVGDFCFQLMNARPDGSISQPYFGQSYFSQNDSQPISQPVSQPVSQPEPQVQQVQEQQYAQPQQQVQQQQPYAQPRQDYQQTPPQQPIEQPQPVRSSETVLNVGSTPPPSVPPQSFQPVEEDYSDYEEDAEDMNVQDKKKSNLSKIALAVSAVIIVAVIAVVFFLSGEDAGDRMAEEEAIENSEDVSREVAEAPIETGLGNAKYTGSIDGNGVPHGQGVATFIGNDMAKEYDGEWTHGKMNGRAKYTFKSGDTFVGTFENDAFKEGKITIKSDGSYFEGQFSDGVPDEKNGKWYDKNGKPI